MFLPLRDLELWGCITSHIVWLRSKFFGLYELSTKGVHFETAVMNFSCKQLCEPIFYGCCYYRTRGLRTVTGPYNIYQNSSVAFWLSIWKLTSQNERTWTAEKRALLTLNSSAWLLFIVCSSCGVRFRILCPGLWGH